MRSDLPLINVYRKKNITSKIVTQLIYGDTFKIIKKSGSWIKIKNDFDYYKGFIKNRKFPQNQKNNFKVWDLSANLYTQPNVSSKIENKLTFGSRIKITRKKNNFYKFENLWIEKKNLKKINYKAKDIFKGIKKFINVKYKWGGKHYSGIDCSALIQLFFNINNKFCPRDTKDQIKYFKKKIKIENIRKNDLIFWKGHVALAISKRKLIHAYGPLKKTVVMPIGETINRINKTANLKTIGIRRIS